MMPATPSQSTDTPGQLIIGIDSMIGTSLARRLDQLGVRYHGTSRRNDSAWQHLDLDDAKSIDRFAIPRTVQTAYLLSAMTSLKRCRQEPEAAHRINVVHSSRLMEHLSASGVRIVMISTNQVFDGSRPWRKPDEPTCPLSVYGQTKAALEKSVLAHHGSIIRPTKVLGSMPPLWQQWQEHWKRGEGITAFDDLHIAPVSQRTLIEHLLDPQQGITHLSGDEDVSYAQVAEHLATRWGFDCDLIKPTSAADAGIPFEERPPHTTLAGGRYEHIWDVIDAAIADSN